jgi:hypothetical protein
MKPSTKAALISGLVFPGLGHLVLRRGLRGCLFLVPAALATFYLLARIGELMDQLLAELNAGTLALDPVQLLERIHASGIDNPASNAAALVCMLCWAGAIADALWLGRRATIPSPP